MEMVMRKGMKLIRKHYSTEYVFWVLSLSLFFFLICQSSNFYPQDLNQTLADTWREG